MDIERRSPVSRTQLEILRLINLGFSNHEIADRMGITVGTTKWHLYQMFRRLGVGNRTAAAVKGHSLELL